VAGREVNALWSKAQAPALGGLRSVWNAAGALRQAHLDTIVLDQAQAVC